MRFVDIAKQALSSFPVIFTLSILGAWTSSWAFSGGNFLPHSKTVWQILATTVLITFTYFIFYSRIDLNKRQISIRCGMHFLMIATIVVTSAHFWSWKIVENSLIQTIVLVGLVAMIYFIVTIREFFLGKRLAANLMGRIEEQE